MATSTIAHACSPESPPAFLRVAVPDASQFPPPPPPPPARPPPAGALASTIAPAENNPACCTNCPLPLPLPLPLPAAPCPDAAGPLSTGRLCRCVGAVVTEGCSDSLAAGVVAGDLRGAQHITRPPRECIVLLFSTYASVEDLPRFRDILGLKVFCSGAHMDLPNEATEE
jgi:hypothetical protein